MGESKFSDQIIWIEVIIGNGFGFHMEPRRIEIPENNFRRRVRSQFIRSAATKPMGEG